MKRSRLRRKGKRGLAWDRTRAKLKVRFERAGLTRCEVCGTDNALGFSHSKPRRMIATQADLEEVALLCNADHHEADSHGHERQEQIIKYIISKREIQP